MLRKSLVQLQTLGCQNRASGLFKNTPLLSQSYHYNLPTQCSNLAGNLKHLQPNVNFRHFVSSKQQDTFQKAAQPENLKNDIDNDKESSKDDEDPEALVPLDPMQFITESDLGVKFVIDNPKPLEAVSESIHKALQDKDYRYLNPYTYLFPTRTFTLDAAYFPLKVRSMFKSMVPFKREKLEKRFILNFQKLFAAIENNDIETLNSMKLDGTQMAIESFRDVFHTLRAEKIDYKFSIRDIRVIVDHIEPALPFFQANALYFIDGEFRLPSILGDKAIQISYYTPIVWLSRFPDMSESDKRELEDINFDTEIEWKPARIEMIGAVRETANKKVEEIMARLKTSYKRIVEEAEERQEQRLEVEKSKSQPPSNTKK